MASLLRLPTELLQVIISQLYFPDLGNFANSRLSLSRACKARVLEHTRLESFAQSLDGRTESNLEYHVLLVTFLMQPEGIHYVEKFDASTSYSEEPIILAPEHRPLVSKALHNSQWLSAEDYCFIDLQRAASENHFTMDHLLEDGDADDDLNYSILSVLLTMLPRLKKFTLHGECASAFSANSASAEKAFLNLFRRISNAAEQDPSRSPLPCLTDLHLRYLSIHYAAPLMSLPSVRLVTLEGMIEGNEHNGWPAWPPGLPALRVEELRLQDVGPDSRDDSSFELYEEYTGRMPETCVIVRSGPARP